MLHRVQEGSGPPVVLVHGFTQTHRSWDPVAARLATYRTVVRVDLPGHGGSSDVRATVEDSARMLGDTCGEAVYVGYSLGGRISLRLALEMPQLVRALVLVGASPGLADAAAREERRASDEALAETIERDGVPVFLDQWLAQPMFAGVPSDDYRATNTIEGLASSLRLAGVGAMEPLWDRLGHVSMPVQLIVGERDEKFTSIAQQMRTRLPACERIAKIAGVGHAAHLERPDMVEGVIERFLVRHASLTS